MLADYDSLGRETPSGDPTIHYEADAISQALELWVTSKRGETLYNPNDGGILEEYLFKNLNNNSLRSLDFKIRNAINIGFNPSITVIELKIVANKLNNLLSIQLKYTIDQTQEIVEQEIFTNINVNENPSYSYGDISYIEDNLYEFVRLKKIDVPKGSIMFFNYDENKWVWSTYKFINFDFATDSRAEDILALANGS